MKPVLAWQYKQLIKELILLQEHDSNQECPCKSEGEHCVWKHLSTIQAYAEETLPIEVDQTIKDKLYMLAHEAGELADMELHRLCGGEVVFPVELSTWSRDKRKDYESLIFSTCSAIGDEAKAHADYTELSHQAESLGDDEAAETFKEIAADEKEHQHILEKLHLGGNNMPDIYDRCVRDVQTKIDAGDMPAGSNPHAICTAAFQHNTHWVYPTSVFRLDTDSLPDVYGVQMFKAKDGKITVTIAFDDERKPMVWLKET